MRSPEEIKRDLEAVKEYFEANTDGCSPMCLSEAIAFIDQEQRPDAKWIRGIDDFLGVEYWRCSNCAIRQPIQMNIEFARWCPFCRAPMKGEK